MTEERRARDRKIAELQDKLDVLEKSAQKTQLQADERARKMKEEMMKLDPTLAESPWIFPSDEILDQAYVFRPLTPEEQVQYTDAFGRVIQG